MDQQSVSPLWGCIKEKFYFPMPVVVDGVISRVHQAEMNEDNLNSVSRNFSHGLHTRIKKSCTNFESLLKN